MRLSSIFSFDTLKSSYRPGGWVVILAVLILGTEALLHIQAVRDILPPPEIALWHTEMIQPKLEYLKQFEAGRGVDILFIGNSTMQAGLNPQIFDERRGRGGDAGPGAFNAAIEGLPPYGTRLFLEIFLRYTRPKAVILGLSPQDLNSNSPWARDVTDRVKHSPLALAEARWGLRGRLIAMLIDNSQLYRYRLTIYQWLLRGGQMREPAEVYFDERGYHPLDRRLADLPANQRAGFYNRAGVLNYSTQGLQMDSLLTLIEACKVNGMELILVNMPVADDYYKNFDRPDDYQDYLEALSEIAAQYQLSLWDYENLPKKSGFSDQHFADFNHLNRTGAAQLSQLMGANFNRLVESGHFEALQ